MIATLGLASTGGTLALNLNELIGSHLCVAANSGGGKSGAIRKLLEATHGQVQHIVLDAEDEFYTLRERFDYVIAGGDGGDVPATLANAGGLASAALAHGFSLITQINDLGDDAPAFIADFLDTLIAAPREQWRPLLVVIDEAQHFAPTSGQSVATAAIKNLLQRGRKRGFTAVVASTRISELHPGVRGLARNWMLGLVGQSLDRRTAADQLGFAPSSAEARALQSLEPRQFWGFGPAIARQPVLFTIGDVETTIVKSGQAKVPTPPAPEALRAILSGLATAPIETICAPGSADKSLVADEMAELLALRAERDEWTVERGVGQQQIDALIAENRALHALAAQIGALASDMARISPALEQYPAGNAESTAKEPGTTDTTKRLRMPPTQHGRADTSEQATGRQVATARRDTSGGSPAALAIADLLDRINPARVTWSQAATMTGRKASGGNFNSARKWLRESGRLIEDGEFIRSSADAPAGMDRPEALDLWKSVLTNPAPRMIDALDSAARPIGKDDLGAMVGAVARGGNFNNGLAQLRRNGLLAEVNGGFRLADPLPGERA